MATENYTQMPWWLWQQYGFGNTTPTPTPTPTGAGGIAPISLGAVNPSGIYGNYTPAMDIPLVAPPTLPNVPFDPAAAGLEFPGSETPGPYDIPPDEPPGGPVTAGEVGNPPTELFPPGSKVPGTLYPTTPGGAPATPGDRNVAGLNLTLNDRINMVLNNLGLPPLPTGFNMFGGLPPGMTENPNLGGGAPIFSYTNPTLNTGPQWNPGGSIFGGRGLPIVVGGGNPGNLGGGGAGYGLPWGNALFHGIWYGNRPMPYSTWLANAGWRNYQGQLPGTQNAGSGGIGGTYQNYLNIWNNLRSKPPVITATESTGIGLGGGGRPQTKGYQFGGVAGDDDFYASIGRPVYNAGRKTEDAAGNVFHALGALGKYLQGGATKNVAPGPVKTSGVGDYLPPSANSLIEWMMKPSAPTPSAPIITLPDQPAAGRRKIIRDLNQKRFDIYNQTIPPVHDPAWYYPPVPSAKYQMASTDTQPAMLTPGEMVLNDQQQSAVMPIPGREGLLRADQRAKLAEKMWS